MSLNDVHATSSVNSRQSFFAGRGKAFPGGLMLAAFCIFLVGLLFLPFINKALHIDDYYFLVWGDLFDWNPLKALPKDFMHQGLLVTEALPYDLTHPLLIPYLLKVLQSIFGHSELPLHLFFLLFPLLALWSLARLLVFAGYENKLKALIPLALFGTLPAFVVNGQNLMSDVPTLAFLLAGTASVVETAAGERDTVPWQGVLWLTCAVFSSYQALFFVVLLMVFVLLNGRPLHQRFHLVLVLAIPLMLMLSWLILVYFNYGTFPGQKASGVGSELIRGSQLHVIWARTVFAFAMIGASLVFVLPLRLARESRRSLFRLGAACCVIGALSFLIAPAEAGEGVRRAALALLCSIGVVGFWLTFWGLKSWYLTAPRRPVVLLCGGWIAISLLYNLLLLPFGNARYLLPLFPMLFLVLLKDFDFSTGFLTRLAGGMIVLSMLWGFMNAWSDYSYAGTYRTMAGEIAEFRRSLSSNRQVWYVGEWGMRHYFDRVGARYLLANSTEPQSGDFVIIPEMAKFWTPSTRLRPRLNFYASREFCSPLPLRLFNRRSGAGFYCHYWGMLPFAFSSEPDEVFVIQEVR